MKKAALSLILLMASSAVWADWVRYAENEIGDVFFYEDKSVKKEENPTVWILIDYKTPLKHHNYTVQSTKYLLQAYCKERSTRELSSYGYAQTHGEGKIVHIRESGGKWAPVSPGSAEEDFFNLLCKS